MRSSEDIMKLILDLAYNNENIRLAGMEGSRVNKNIKDDIFSDFDITYFVKEKSEFIQDDNWLSHFGHIIMLQKPEDMELFPAEEYGFSYLVTFDDHIKIDITILETADLKRYLAEDGLRAIILDKDNLLKEKITPSDEEYHIKKPSARSFDDCCNEFWNTLPYVVKGIYRREILFAIDHLTIIRNELLRMVSWSVGIEYGFKFSIGKNYKFLDKYINENDMKNIESTYNVDSYEVLTRTLIYTAELFRTYSKKISETFGYNYPEYDKNMTSFLDIKYLPNIGD